MAKVQKEIRKSGKSLGKNLRRANKKSDLERKEKKPFSSKDGLDCVGITSVVSRWKSIFAIKFFKRDWLIESIPSNFDKKQKAVKLVLLWKIYHKVLIYFLVSGISLERPVFVMLDQIDKKIQQRSNDWRISQFFCF